MVPLDQPNLTCFCTSEHVPIWSLHPRLQALRAIADKLEQQPELLVSSVHALSEDFWLNRLPPHPQQLPKQGPQPSMDDSIWCRTAGYSYLLPEEGLGVGDRIGEEVEKKEEEEEEGGGGVKLISCLNNIRETHMIRFPESDEEGDELDREALFGSDDDIDDDDDDDDDDGGSDDEDDEGMAAAAKAAMAKLAEGTTAGKKKEKKEVCGKN